MQRYARKSTTVEAMQYDPKNRDDILNWTGGQSNGMCIRIDTRDGPTNVLPKDYVVRDPEGNFHRCGERLFRTIYEPADESKDAASQEFTYDPEHKGETFVASIPKVGDRDSTPYGNYNSNNAMNDWCGERQEGQIDWICTREKDHNGWHIAGDGEQICSVWPAPDKELTSFDWNKNGSIHVSMSADGIRLTIDDANHLTAKRQHHNHTYTNNPFPTS